MDQCEAIHLRVLLYSNPPGAYPRVRLTNDVAGCPGWFCNFPHELY